MCLAVPGKVIAVSNEDPLLKMGKVSFGGVIKKISLAYVPQVQLGEYVIVHAGFALSIIDSKEAAQTLSYIEQITQHQT